MCETIFILICVKKNLITHDIFVYCWHPGKNVKNETNYFLHTYHSPMTDLDNIKLTLRTEYLQIT